MRRYPRTQRGRDLEALAGITVTLALVDVLVWLLPAGWWA